VKPKQTIKTTTKRNKSQHLPVSARETSHQNNTFQEIAVRIYTMQKDNKSQQTTTNAMLRAMP